jgi:hypothetical protein
MQPTNTSPARCSVMEVQRRKSKFNLRYQSSQGLFGPWLLYFIDYLTQGSVSSSEELT